MTQYAHRLPRARPRSGGELLAQIIAWTVLLGLAFSPRLGIVGFWIFGDQLGDAYSSWIVPTLGFFLLPWTTLAYVVMWGITSNGVADWEWIVVGLSFLVDVSFWLWVWLALRR